VIYSVCAYPTFCNFRFSAKTVPWFTPHPDKFPV
jgi:hypothetical protein